MFVEDKPVITNTPTKTGVGAGKIFGVRRVFIQIYQTCPKKNYKIITSKKTCAFHFGRHFFQIKAHQVRFLPEFLITMTSKKNHLHFDFGRLFSLMKAHQAILRRL